MKYSIGWNMRGYMPDNEPLECETLAEAKKVLMGDIENYIDSVDDLLIFSEDVKRFKETFEQVKDAEPQTCNVYLDSIVFWIQEL